MMFLYFFFFFFFQAEDGIRDKLVTGVQTCALPIYPLLADADAMAAGEPHLARETVRQMERFYRDTFADRPVPIPHPRFEALVGNPALVILALSVRVHADLDRKSTRLNSSH